MSKIIPIVSVATSDKYPSRRVRRVANLECSVPPLHEQMPYPRPDRPSAPLAIETLSLQTGALVHVLITPHLTTRKMYRIRYLTILK